VLLEDIFKTWKKVIQNKEIPDNVKRFVISYKNAIINFPSEAVSEIARFYNQNVEIFNGVKIAMLMESPDQVVFPHLMEKEKVSFKINVFYTLEAAFRWLNEPF
jgi:hypothetical protein